MPNTKLIVKNTIALYARSFIALVLSLFTSRLVLEYLGIEDFGVYNAVGGIVFIVGFIQSSMANATQRFLAFYIGKGDNKRLNEVFSMCVNVHFLISLALVVAIEIIGMWYLNNRLDYGSVDISVVRLIFHTSVATLFFMINSVPFNSLLIARESMKVFAYIDILSRFLTFALALSLALFVSQIRLSIYAVSILGINIIICFIYLITCYKRFNESHYTFFWDKELFQGLFSYTGWVSLPALVSIFKSQGMILVLNSVFGPLVNAAQGVANQINNAIKSLANNVGAAFAPQITITYAQEDYTSMMRLFILGSKITFFLFAYMAIPLCVEMDFVLAVWLKEVPPYASTIAILIMLDTLISSMTSCYNTAIRATGDIKFYELTYNLFHFVGILLIIVIARIGCAYYVPYIILAVFSFLSMFWQFYCMKRVMPFISVRDILISIVQMSIIAVIASIITSLCVLCQLNNEWLEFFFVLIVSTVSLSALILTIGFTGNERESVVRIIKTKLHLHNNSN